MLPPPAHLDLDALRQRLCRQVRDHFQGTPGQRLVLLGEIEQMEEHTRGAVRQRVFQALG